MFHVTEELLHLWNKISELGLPSQFVYLYHILMLHLAYLCNTTCELRMVVAERI